MMLVFVLGAAVSFAAFVGDDMPAMFRQLPFWGPAIVLMGLSIGREPSVVFLALFILPTLVMGVACFFKRISPTPFLIFALSDIVLGIAFSIYQSKTALWTLPDVNAWGPAAGICAGAAILRLAAATAVSDTREGGLVSLGWWQGALLAYWAGSQGVIVLVTGGILIWLIAAFYSQSSMVGLTLAGGTLAIAAGLGAGFLGVASIGFAGIGLALGDRTASVWAAGLMPLSIASTLAIPSGNFLIGPALFLPGALAVLAAALGSLKAEEEREPLLNGLAGLVGVAYLAAIGEALLGRNVATSTALGGAPLPAVAAMWAILGAGMAGVAAGALTQARTGGYRSTRYQQAPAYQSPPAYRQPYQQPPAYQAGYQTGLQQRYQPPVRTSQFDDITMRLVPPVGWFVFGVAVLVAVRLFLAGFRTGFL